MVSSYEAYISENPKDTHALILFGKFLSQVGQQKHALNYFLEADALSPKIAVEEVDIEHQCFHHDIKKVPVLFCEIYQKL